MKDQLYLPTTIDNLVHDKLHKLRMTPWDFAVTRSCQRLYLDITGLLPTWKNPPFLKDSSPDKRAKLLMLLEKERIYRIMGNEIFRTFQIQTDDNQGMSYKATLRFSLAQDENVITCPWIKSLRISLTSSGELLHILPQTFIKLREITLKSPACRFSWASANVVNATITFDRWTQDVYFFRIFF